MHASSDRFFGGVVAATQAVQVVDPEDDEEILILVKLEGVSALEPLGEAGWQSLLRFSGARLAAMAGEECVADLGDGNFLVRVPRDPSQAMALLDAMRRALLSPVPGIGHLPSLDVRFSSV